MSQTTAASNSPRSGLGRPVLTPLDSSARNLSLSKSLDHIDALKALPPAASKHSPRSLTTLEGHDLEPVYVGQHFLWKTRQRLVVDIEKHEPSATLVVHVEVQDEKTGNRWLDPMFLDMALVARQVDDVVEKEALRTIAAMEKGAAKLKDPAKRKVHADVRRSTIGNFVLRRIGLTKGEPHAPASPFPSLPTADQVTLKTLATDTVAPETLIRSDNPGIVCRPRRSSERRSLCDFELTHTELSSQRMLAAQHRESGSNLHADTVNVLHAALDGFRALQLNRKPWAQLTTKEKWRLLLRRFFYKATVQKVRARLESSPAYRDMLLAATKKKNKKSRRSADF